MNHVGKSGSKPGGMLTAALVIGTLVGSSGDSEAGIVLNPGSTGYSNFQLDTIQQTSGTGPNFVNGVLFSPGNGFPTLTGTLEGTTPQVVTQSPISTNFVSTASAEPSGFGTATTDMLATLSGGNGASSARGGIFWLKDTSLSDNLSGTSGLASVSISIATASFTNTSTSTSVNINNPGALLSVSGTLGTNNSTSNVSYVAAGLTSSFTLSEGGVTISTTTLGNIVLAASRSGASFASNGGVGGGAASASLEGGTLSATASTTNPGGSITLLPGETISLSAILTLISDPGSTIHIDSNLSPGFPSNPNDIPDFGIIAGGPGLAAVPEPSTVVLIGLGLAASGLWARSSRRRGPAGI